MGLDAEVTPRDNVNIATPTDEEKIMSEAAETALSPAAAIAKHKLDIVSTFVPFSQSRNKTEKTPSLNWRVTLRRDGREVLTTDYSAGCAHAPSYKQTQGRRTVEDDERDRCVKSECENGFAASKYGAPYNRQTPDPAEARGRALFARSGLRRPRRRRVRDLGERFWL
jgi:hypothetical protein